MEKGLVSFFNGQFFEKYEKYGGFKKFFNEKWPTPNSRTHLQCTAGAPKVGGEYVARVVNAWDGEAF